MRASGGRRAYVGRRRARNTERIRNAKRLGGAQSQDRVLGDEYYIAQLRGRRDNWGGFLDKTGESQGDEDDDPEGVRD